MVFFKKSPVYLKNGLYLHADLFTKEHPRSQDCIRTSDDLKMRLEKPILFVCADKNRFQINQIFLEKKNPHYLQINPLYLQIMGVFQKNPVYLREKPILSGINLLYLIIVTTVCHIRLQNSQGTKILQLLLCELIILSPPDFIIKFIVMHGLQSKRVQVTQVCM